MDKMLYQIMIKENDVNDYILGRIYQEYLIGVDTLKAKHSQQMYYSSMENGY